MNARDYVSETAMVAARYDQNPEVITALLKAGADIEARDTVFGMTPLMRAAKFNQNPNVITTLIEAGANERAKDKAGKTAFDYAQGNRELKGTDAYRQLQGAS